MLIDFAFPSFNRLMNDYIFMQDGVSPHSAIPVRNYLNTKSPNNWIVRGRPVSWLAWTPDLNLCEFFLWAT